MRSKGAAGPARRTGARMSFYLTSEHARTLEGDWDGMGALIDDEILDTFAVVAPIDKLAAKMYSRHSGYPGGLRSRSLGEMLERRPEEVIRKAVKGMLPTNRLAAKMLTKLRVFPGAAHDHEAQNPVKL